MGGRIIFKGPDGITRDSVMRSEMPRDCWHSEGVMSKVVEATPVQHED